ncbi:hypothetical protein PENTCL1PPCAC_5255, partial [Pristionchus entomophagus]
MVVRFSDRLEIRDLPPPPSTSSSFSTASSSAHSLGPYREEQRGDRRHYSQVSTSDNRYIPPRPRLPMATSPVQLRADSLLMRATG